MSVPKFSYEPKYISLERKRTTGEFYIRETESEAVVGNAYSEERAKLFAASDDLLQSCIAQHRAIDQLFAMLIQLTGKYTPDKVFYPTQSPMWASLVAGNEAIKRAGGKL